MSNRENFNALALLPVKHEITMSGLPPPKMAKTRRDPRLRTLRPSDAIEIKCEPKEFETDPKVNCLHSENAPTVSSESVSTVSGVIRSEYIRKRDGPIRPGRSTNSVRKNERSNTPCKSTNSVRKNERSNTPLLKIVLSKSIKLPPPLPCGKLESKRVPENGAQGRSKSICPIPIPIKDDRSKSICPIPVKDDSLKKNFDGTSSSKILPRNPIPTQNGPALKFIWKGSFEIFHTKEDIRFCEGVIAHPSAKVSRKAFEFTKQIAGVIMFVMVPRTSIWPKVFKVESPDRNDIALYFYPARHERSKRQYSSILKFMEKQDLVLRSQMGKVDLLVCPSKLLKASSQQLKGSYFLWGVFSCKKDEDGAVVAEKACLSSALVVYKGKSVAS